MEAADGQSWICVECPFIKKLRRNNLITFIHIYNKLIQLFVKEEKESTVRHIYQAAFCDDLTNDSVSFISTVTSGPKYRNSHRVFGCDYP